MTFQQNGSAMGYFRIDIPHVDLSIKTTIELCKKDRSKADMVSREESPPKVVRTSQSHSSTITQRNPDPRARPPSPILVYVDRPDLEGESRQTQKAIY